jgi:hypothetical protein
VTIRQFLNRPGWHGKAALIASVEDTSKLPEDALRFPRLPDVYLSISDCSRECSLEFDLDTRDGQANSLYKLDTLIYGLERFRHAIEAEIELYNQRQKGNR